MKKVLHRVIGSKTSAGQAGSAEERVLLVITVKGPHAVDAEQLQALHSALFRKYEGGSHQAFDDAALNPSLMH
jgi:hypothetical protein